MAESSFNELAALIATAIAKAPIEDQRLIGDAMEWLAENEGAKWRRIMRHEAHYAMVLDCLAETVEAMVSTDPNAEYLTANQERRALWAEEEAEAQAKAKADLDLFLDWANAPNPNEAEPAWQPEAEWAKF